MNKQLGVIRPIDVIAVLALVFVAFVTLFPVFARHPSGRRDTTCLTNMKQLSLALAQYSQDNDELLPASKELGHGAGWAGAIYPYVKSTLVYCCPDDPGPAVGSITPLSYPVSYGLNSVLTEPNSASGKDDSQAGTIIVGVADPKKTILLFELRGSRAAITSPDEGGSGRYRTSVVGDGLNLLSYDGKDKEQVGDSVSVGGAKYATGHVYGWNNTAQPNQWLDKPAHESGGSYLLADLHAKRLQPESVSVVQDGGHQIYWREQ